MTREAANPSRGASVALGRVGVGVAALALLGPFLKGWRGGQVINISTALQLVEKVQLHLGPLPGNTSALAASEFAVGY